MAPDLDILADGTRRTMLALLTIEAELCVCEFEAALAEIQPVVSRHMAILREGRWVTGRREGRRIYYRLGVLPAWALQLVDAYAKGGVSAADLKRARARLAQFTGRPLRLTRAAS